MTIPNGYHISCYMSARVRAWLGILCAIFYGAIFLPSVVLAQVPVPGGNTGNTGTICSTLNTDLERGASDSSPDGPITALQNFLYAQGYYPHPGVGDFGWLTFWSVANFQGDHGLPATGYFGPMTRAYIQDSACPSPVISPPANTDTTIVAGTTATTSSVAADYNTSSDPSDNGTAGTTTLPLPYQAPPFFPAWHGTWGSASTSPSGTLRLGATASTTGASALLSGSDQWTDYAYTAGVIANVNGGFSLLARYTDSNNYVACNFNGRYVSITQMLDGKRTQAASVWLQIPPPGSVLVSTNARITVNGSHVSCSATSAEDVSYDITSVRLLKGGIGISIWYSVIGVSTLDLQSVHVDLI